jgi:hypothetical protein
MSPTDQGKEPDIQPGSRTHKKRPGISGRAFVVFLNGQF